MTDPRARLIRLNAALDGELDAMAHAALERDMLDDPVLAAEFARLTALREGIRRAAPRERAPTALAERIAAMASAPDVAPVAPTPVAPMPASSARRAASARSWRWTGGAFSQRGAYALAASLAVLGFVAGSGVTAFSNLGRPSGVDTALVSDFTRAAISGQPFDVASSDRHTVKPWLAGRTTVSAEIVDLAAQGFPLVGGRVSVVDRIPAPTLVYRRHEHLFAVTELPSDAPGVRNRDGSQTIDGYNVARWSDKSLSFVAVTDADDATLQEFVAAFREARKPAGEQ